MEATMAACITTDGRRRGHSITCQVKSAQLGEFEGMVAGMVPQPSDIPPKPAMWQRFLDGLQKVVSCFGRVTFLVDENTQAFHFFITALLAFLDKAGSLYGEIARFVIKLLGFGRRSKRTLTAGQSARAVEAKVGATEIFKTIWKTNGKVQDT